MSGRNRGRIRDRRSDFFRSFNFKKALKSTFLLFSAGPDNQHVLLAALKTMLPICLSAMILEKLVPENAVGEILKKGESCS